MSRILQILFLFFISSGCLYAQQDSFFVHPKKLAVADILKPIEEDKGKIEIISGSRFAIAASELPFSTYIITKEEIRQNGYETLVDALKMVPGIFTSQPGSAVEGETFLMRGLLGNSYTKILVNDIPIKPVFLASMPIGAQLPIREAERIEIIYGAGAALYGADATAGVINIITKKSDKPVYMQADLSVGVGHYSSVNVMFGGKWGRNKNILHYYAYGSNVIYESRFIERDFFENYNTEKYPWLTLENDDFKSLSNYQEEDWGDPRVNNTPHLSRKFGLHLKFRRVSLSLETMTRRDHSSIGLNPVAVTYSNPLNYTGETIERINLNFYNKKENRDKKTDFTFIRYRQDGNSSISFVQNRLGVELQNLALANANKIDPFNAAQIQPAIFQSYYEKYLSGTRFMYAISDEYRVEHVRNYRLFKTSSLTLGANIKAATGVPSTNFLLRPPEDDGTVILATPDTDFLIDTLTFPVSSKLWGNFEGNTFGQLFYAGKKFNLSVGFNYSFYTARDLTFQKVFLPRIAGLFKITESLNVRSSWGKAYRAPNVFYDANSYRISNRTANEVTRSPFTRLQAETTTSWESGIRFITGKEIDLDFTYFTNETKNLINYGRRDLVEEPDGINYDVILGYSNANNSTIKYQGGQVSTGFGLGDKLDAKYSFSWTKSKLNRAGLDENFFLPQYNARIHQWRVTYKPFNTTTLILDYRKVRNKQTAVNIFDNEGTTKFATIDLVGRYTFTDRFDAYFKIINLTNKQYPGIPASRTPDDLLTNPQYGISIRLGMNYYLE